MKNLKNSLLILLFLSTALSATQVMVVGELFTSTS